MTSILRHWFAAKRSELEIENVALKRALRAALEQMDNANVDRDEAQVQLGSLQDRVKCASECSFCGNGIDV